MADLGGSRDPKTGRILPGSTLNPRGRPRKVRTVDEAILNAVHEPVTVTVNGRRKRRTKLEVTAAQFANQGASGNLSAGKTALDLVRRAEERRSQGSSASVELPLSDREIAERFIAKLRRMIEAERDDDAAAN